NVLSAVQASALAVDPSGHPFISWTELSSGRPQIYVRANRFDVGKIYQVSLTGGPNVRSSVQTVLNNVVLHAGDVILLDKGIYASAISLTHAPAGILIVGSPSAPTILAGALTGTNATGVTFSRLNMTGGANLT